MSKVNHLIIQRQTERNQNYIKYRNYALDVFRWSNLPDGIESRDIEMQLYENGQCFFFFHEALQQYLCLPCFDTNTMDLYGKYIAGNVHSYNGAINQQVNYKTDGCLIINNDFKVPTEGYIREYSDRMSDVELGIKMNINQMKLPYVVATSKKTELSWRNMIQQVQLGNPAVFVSEDFKLDNLRILPAQAPYLVDDLNRYRYELERELLTFLGINNTYEKTERLISGEVDSNNEFIQRNIEVQFKHRLDACKRINEKYGLNIKVEKVTKLIKEEEIQYQALEEGLGNLVDNIEESDLKEYSKKGNGQLFNLLHKAIVENKIEGDLDDDN